MGARHLPLRWLALASAIALTRPSIALADYPSVPQITDRDSPGQLSLMLQDYAVVPKSGTTQTAQVARINFMRPEPVTSLAATRTFANDLNGNLYIFNKASKTFSSYLNFPSIFNGTGGTGTFDSSPGFAAGLVTFAFDPSYATNGKFYTVHTELGGGTDGFRQAVLEEWHDTNINDGTFTGTRAEMLRLDYSDPEHPMGDILFNPLATNASHPDWRNMYIASGDGGAGETSGPTRDQDQMLNNLLGKILRIQPSVSGTPGTYTIPSGNPFTTTPNARGEIYAYGFRNPHRISWDVDPQNTANNHLIVNDIGLYSWEEVNIVHAGANYGYSRIEGNMVLGTDNNVNTSPLPATLPIYTNTTASSVGSITPSYPVALYSHRDGDAISSGFVYRGNLMPELRGKYIFGDITTGRLFYSDLNQMLAADDGDPATVAPIDELKLYYSSPYDSAGLVPRRIFDIAHDEYDRRNETAVGSTANDGTVDNDKLPTGAAATFGNDPYGVPYFGGGRADIRLVMIDNELYLLTKSDGTVRLLTEPLGGDSNLDGIVDIRDLLALATDWQNSGTWKTGDFDHSGFVDQSDLAILAQHWQQGPGALGASLNSLGLPETTTVPEPASISLIVLGCQLLLSRRRRR